MRAVDAPVAVQLVHHHVAQVLEELPPLRVVGQDPLVEHVRVRDHDMGPSPDRLPCILRGVAVVGEGADIGPERLDHRVELGELVLGERLRREEVQGPRVGVLQDAVEDGQVVAERLPGGGGGDDHRVATGLDRVVGLALVRVEALVAARLQRLAELRVEVRREVREPGGLGREVAERGQHRLGAQGLLDLEALQDREQGPLGVFPAQDELLAHDVPRSAPPPRGLDAPERIMQEGTARGGPIELGGAGPHPPDPPFARPK